MRRCALELVGVVVCFFVFIFRIFWFFAISMFSLNEHFSFTFGGLGADLDGV